MYKDEGRQDVVAMEDHVWWSEAEGRSSGVQKDWASVTVHTNAAYRNLELYHGRIWTKDIGISDTGGENTGTQPASNVTLAEVDLGHHVDGDEFCKQHTFGEYTGVCTHRMSSIHSPTCPEHSEQRADASGGAIKREIRNRAQGHVTPIHIYSRATCRILQ